MRSEMDGGYVLVFASVIILSAGNLNAMACIAIISTR